MKIQVIRDHNRVTPKS